MKMIHRSVVAVLLVFLSHAAFAALKDKDIVLRAGKCTAALFTAGAESEDTQDKLYGVSVFAMEGVTDSSKIWQITKANPGFTAPNGGCWARKKAIVDAGGTLRKKADAANGKPDHYVIDGLTAKELKAIFQARFR